MKINSATILFILIVNSLICAAQKKEGATLPWVTYEAEQMHTNGNVLGPVYTPYRVETESSGQQCVQLSANGQFIEFNASANANSMVIRYSLPDSKQGGGLNGTLAIYKNKKRIKLTGISSRNCWLYGKYPFTNNPEDGVPRHFYDEIRLTGFKISKGDFIKIERADQEKDSATYCIIDLVDLENIAAPILAPPNSLSIVNIAFRKNDTADYYTEAFKKCIIEAKKTGKSVWIPAGNYKITGDIVVPSNITIQGAGMWYTQLVGDEKLYVDDHKRVRIKGDGNNIHLADFAIDGKLNYRSDQEENDGIVGTYGTNSTISHIWIEHTKVGMWMENAYNLKITGCRMRNTMADGINFCVGMAHSSITNCTARGTGDDCFAIWPTIYATQQFSPGQNLISHCTAQLPYLANGAAIYGAKSNAIKNCLFTDISQGSAILISTTFPTENKDKSINNNFSGTTFIEDCTLKTSGGFDHEWDWRAALEICVDKRSIAGIKIKNVKIENSLSNGIGVIAKNEGDKMGVLSNTILENVKISNIGIGVKDKNALFISNGMHGSLVIKNSTISTIKNESTNFKIVQ